ncbi:hypothetical protein DAEQUDRAFT_39287 [Daedalea quercina L-15889]|uniref:DUF6534 domain-containing protein n=1 Tax=Daedalea quercina L-15889 TaxID=1314783 RepID=A0A165LEP6_9APHY|nr:hypothetical protein DAEQUDRAFT_39287 [Daedalea quercina L-15889]
MAGIEFLLGTTIGCGLVGAILSQFLYGLSMTQGVYYFWVYREDSRRLKGLVAWWLLLDTVKEAIALQVLYEDLITNHANLDSIAHLSIAYGAQNILGWILVFSVQCFYINNIKQILQHHRYHNLITGIAFVLAILTLLAGSADAYITGVLWWTLGTARSGLHSPTENVVNRLIKYNADRGIILCMVQLIALATYIYDIHSGTTNITAAIYFAEFNVYCNTGMAALNMRKHMRGTLEDQYSVEIMPMSHGAVDSNNTSSGSESQVASPHTPLLPTSNPRIKE